MTEFPTGLTDPFRFANGARVCSVADWAARRCELRELIVDLEYGGLPPLPDATTFEELHTDVVPCWGRAWIQTGRIHAGTKARPFAFLLSLLIPPGDGPFPVVLNGDACWRTASDEVAAEMMSRRLIFAQFNRVEIVPDLYNRERVSGLYQVYPEGTYGALAAWAWGYHRCVDVLTAMAVVDPARIAVVGHSRGGKCALLAGATDERIALTSANSSGCGGAGCHRWRGPGAESLADAMPAVPYWFGPRLQEFVGRETALPFDQHEVKALVAPRALLTTEALDDPWSNPAGTWQTHLAAREVYRFLHAEERLGIHFRAGGHDHGLADWRAFLDFMQWQLCGQPRPPGFDRNPFPELPLAFSWRAP